MSAKRKLAMSGVAILVVLTLVAGATMAWFTDTCSHPRGWRYHGLVHRHRESQRRL